MKWKCINRESALHRSDHFVFVSATGLVAIADHSMRDVEDPSSTDDGLLVWDGGVTVLEAGPGPSSDPRLLLTVSEGGRGRDKATVSVSLSTALAIERVTGRKVLPEFLSYDDGLQYRRVGGPGSEIDPDEEAARPLARRH